MSASQTSKYDIAHLIALMNLLRMELEERPEMYKLLLAILGDYDPALIANKERTCRYLRVLVTDRILANCLIASLPKGSTEKHVNTTQGQSSLYPLKKRIKYRYFFNPKRTHTSKPHARLIRTNKTSKVVNPQHKSVSSEVSKTTDQCGISETEDDRVETSTPTAENSAVHGLLALSSNCSQTIDTEKQEESSNNAEVMQTNGKESDFEGRGESKECASHDGIRKTIKKHKDTARSSEKQLSTSCGVGVGPSQSSSPSPVIEQLMQPRFVPPVMLGLPYAYNPQLAYGQPVPAFSSYSQSFLSNTALPWSSVQLMPGAHQAQLANLYRGDYQSPCEGLLDLSKTGPQGTYNAGYNKTPVKRTSSTIGVAKPVKRSASISSLESTLTAQAHVKRPKMRSETVTSETALQHEVSNTSSPIPLTISRTNSLEALQQMTMNVDKLVCEGGNKPFQATSAFSASCNFNKNQSNKHTSMYESRASATNNSSSLPQVNELEPKSSINIKDEAGMNGSPIALLAPSVASTAMTVPSVSKMRETSSNTRAFPYSQHVQLPDGTCPLVDFSPQTLPQNVAQYTLQTGQDVTQTPSNTSLNNDGSLFSQVSTDPAHFAHISTPMNNSTKQLLYSRVNDNGSLQNGHQTTSGISDHDASTGREMNQRHSEKGRSVASSNSCVRTMPASEKRNPTASSTIPSHTDSKSRQVKIKLDKQSGSQFLAELLKLRSESGLISVSSSSPVPHTAYRTPVTIAPHRLLVTQSNSSTARQLLLSTLPETSHQQPTFSTIHIAKVSKGTERQRASLSDMCSLTGKETKVKIARVARSRSHSEFDQQRRVDIEAPSPKTIGNYDRSNMTKPGGIDTESYRPMQKNFYVQTMPFRASSEKDSNFTPNSESSLQQVIREKLTQMEGGWSGSQRARASSDSSVVLINRENCLTPQYQQQKAASQYQPRHNTNVPRTAVPPASTAPYTPSAFPFPIGDIATVNQNKSTIFDTYGQHGNAMSLPIQLASSPVLTSKVTQGATDQVTEYNIPSTSPGQQISSIVAQLKPTSPDEDISEHVDTDVLEYSEPNSGASSISLSPYLLSLLPDKLCGEDSDDVFLEEYITPSTLTGRYRPKLTSAPPHRNTL